MTRFWITLDQSVDFVLKCLQDAKGGEIYVPKIPSVKIVDIAEALNASLALDVKGIREGEKLHELMIGQEDARHTLEFDDRFMIVPEIYSHNAEKLKKFLEGRDGKALADDFSYASNTNKQWLSVKDIEEFVRGK